MPTRGPKSEATRSKISASLKRNYSEDPARQRRAEQAASRLDAIRDSAGFQESVTAGLQRVRWKFQGERNAMKRPEVKAKIRGSANGMADPATRAKHLAAVRLYHAKRKSAVRRGIF